MTIPTYMSGLLFTKAHRAVRARIYTILEKYDLNPTSWASLSATVQADGGIRLARVAELLDVKPPLITLISGNLIEQDLIKRIPHHTDKRAKLLVATHKGLKLAAIVEAELDAEIGSLLHGLSQSDILAFKKTLETIIANSEN